MADLKTLRATLVRRGELETELAALSAQEGPLEKDIHRLKIEAHNKQLDAEGLTRPGLRSLVLGWTGKKEAVLTQAVRDARAAKEQLNAADFRLETLRHRTASLRAELEATTGAETAYLHALEAQSANAAMLDEASRQLLRLKQAAALCEELTQVIGVVKDLLRTAARTYETGDIQTDLVGHRYDNKFHTMKGQCRACQTELRRLLSLLEQYTAFYGLNFRSAGPGPWTQDSNYLTAMSYDAKELFERVEDVRSWLQRLERTRQAMKPQQTSTEQTWRQDLRAALFAIHDELSL